MYFTGHERGRKPDTITAPEADSDNEAQ